MLSEVLKAELEESKEENNRILKDIKEPNFKENLLSALDDLFESKSIRDESNALFIEMDDKTIKINLEKLNVTCEQDKQLEQIVTNCVNQIANLS